MDHEVEETAVGVWEKDTITGQNHQYSIRILTTDFFLFCFLMAENLFRKFGKIFLL